MRLKPFIQLFRQRAGETRRSRTKSMRLSRAAYSQGTPGTKLVKSRRLIVIGLELKALHLNFPYQIAQSLGIHGI